MSINKADDNKLLEQTGVNAVFNALKYSQATLRSRISHIKLLEHNKVDLSNPNDFDDDRQIRTLVNSLKTKKNVDISEAYKRQIAMTLKRMYPQSTFQPSKIFKKTAYKETRNSSADFIKNIHTLIKNAGLYLNGVQRDKRIDNTGMYDVCVAMLITCSTSLRINEIMQLRLSDIGKIRENTPLNIRSKSRGQMLRRIAINDVLNDTFNLVLFQRQWYVNYLDTPEFKRINDQSQRYRLDRVANNYILGTSISGMRVKLREFAAMADINVPYLGFNVFRKFITSLLLSKGGFTIAQSMNNHSNLNTTLDHYNVVTNESAEKMYTNILGEASSSLGVVPEESPDDPSMDDDTNQIPQSRVFQSQPSNVKSTINKKIHPYETPSYDGDAV